MKKTLFATTAAIAIGAIPVFANAQQQPDEPQVAEQCLNDLHTFDQEAAETSREGGMVASGEFRQLRQAALVFARNGNEDACQMVLSEMRDLYEERQQSVQETGDDTDPETRMQEQEQRLQAAVSIDQRGGLIRTDDFVGADVRNTMDEDLGDIETVVLDPQEGKVAYVLLSHGGFLGLGEDLIPVRWSDLSVTEDGETYVLDVSQEQIEAAPTISRESFNPEAGEDWRSQIDGWWDDVTSG